MLVRSILLIFFLFIGFEYGYSASSLNQLSLKELFKTTEKSVVFIIAGGQSQGSGVAIKRGTLNNPNSSGTVIVTNAHVVNDFKKVTVYASEKLKFIGNVISVDKTSDLALIQIQEANLKTATTATAEVKLEVADKVFAVGSPKGMSNSLSEGIISGLRKYGPTSVIQTTAAISSGSSGGGLFDKKGRLIGVTSFKIIDSENVNFAVHIKHVLDLLNNYNDSNENRFPSLSMTRLSQGNEYYNNKQYEKAIDEFSKAIKYDDNNVTAYLSRGSAYRKLNRLSLALADYNKSVKLEPDSSVPILARGYVYELMGLYDNAIADYEYGLILDPEQSTKIHSHLSLIFFVVGKYDDAVSSVNKLFDLQFGLDDETLYYTRGYSYYSLNKFELALQDANKAINLAPKYADAYVLRGLIYSVYPTVINNKVTDMSDVCDNFKRACEFGKCNSLNEIRNVCGL